MEKHPEVRKAHNDAKKEHRKHYYASPERKRKYRDLHYRRTFGITLTQYEVMLKKQSHRCAICKTKDPRVVRRKTGYVENFSIDHCHKTKKVRGLLCAHCNRGIGCFMDSVKNLKAAIKYLGGKS